MHTWALWWEACNSQWRRQEFFGAGTPRPLRGYHRPQRVRRAVGPRSVPKFHFFKTIPSHRKWIHFAKISTFFSSEKSIFSKTNFEELSILTRISDSFRKFILQLSMFMKPYKSREIPNELYDLVKKFIKKLKKWLWSRRIFENRMKILEICRENRLEFGEIWKLVNIWRIISIGEVKLS